MTSCYAHEGSAQVVLQVLDGHITVKSPDQQNHYSEGVVNPACTAPAADHWMQKWKEMSSSDQTQPSKHLLSAALLKRLSGLRFRPPASQLEEVDCEGHEGLQSLLQSGGLFFGRNLRLSGKVLLQNNDRLKSSFGLARVHYAEELEDYSPVLIDQAIQVSLGLCLHQLSEAEREKGAVPIQVEKFSVFRPKILAQYDWLHCVVEVKPKVIDSAICASFALIASDGTLVAAAHNLWGKLQSSKAVPLQELMWQIRPTDLPPAEPVKQKKFLAFCEDDSIMAQLMKKNQVAPDDVIIIGAEEQHKSVSLSIATALQRTRTSLEEIDAFIYEWTSGVDVNRLSEAAVAAADRKIRRQCAAFRELIIFVSTSPKDILVITKGSPQFAEQKSEVKHPGSGMFMAMTKSLVNEGQPGKGLLHCIELADTTAATIETLAKEITNPRQDTSELRICDGQAQRLELLPELVSYDSLLQQGCLKKASTASTYVILGGLKGESLSSLLLQFLAQRQHGDNIVVVGRSGPDEAFKVLQKKVVKEFGVRVIPIQADITEPNSLALALQKCGIKSKDVKGVLHGAACFDGDRMIHKVTDEQFDKTLAPKVRGSLEILATSQREEWSLDFFWYISSVVVALGNYGQVAYGGANAFQADLGTWQSWMQNKTKVQVINFTVLDDVGVMHGQQKMQKNLDETRGFPAINKATIYQALDATMRLGLPMVTVATFDRQKLATLALANDPCVASRFHTVMARFTGASTPRATSATSATSAAPSSAASSAESVASASVAPATAVAPASEPTSAAAPALPAAPARTVVAAPPVAAPVAASVAQREAFLQKIKDVMGVTELDMTKSLERQGLDSMTAIECRQQLKDAFRIDVELLELSERRLSDVLKKTPFRIDVELLELSERAFALWWLRLRTKAKRSAWSRGMLLGVSSRARHPLRDVWIRLRLAPSRARVACTRPRPAVWKSSSTVVAVLPTCEGA
eukprot:s4182_g2.t2